MMSITLCYINVFAQVGSFALEQVPQAPNTSALGRFVEIPVGHYSGIPDITVPIYEFSVKNFTMPISLSYHASGLKVRETTGWIGAGWSLSGAGGMITRIVRGHPDDHYPILTPQVQEDNRNNDIKSRIGSSYPNWTSEFHHSDQLRMAISSPNVTHPPKSNGAWGERIDTEIDLFYFNFNGHSGQFTFTNSGLPMLLSGNDLKIEYANRTFKIIDSEGIEYYFDAVETAKDKTSNYRGVDGRTYVSSWYVSKVMIPYSNQTIDFTYQSYANSTLYHNDINSTYMYVKHELIKQEDNSYPWTVGCGNYTSSYSPERPPTGSTALFLDEITWNGKKIKFYGGLTRTDVYKYKLDSIKVTDGVKLIKKAIFNYDYFNPSATNRADKRLKLEEVIVDDQSYKFNYYESYHGIQVPGMGNRGVDLWGFYNGEDENIHYDDSNPFTTNQYGPNYKQYTTYILGANSTPLNSDAKYAVLGSLASITYPTGGKTIFEYEGNDYSKFPFSTDQDSLEKDVFTQIKMDSVFSKYCRSSNIVGGTGNEPYNVRNFVIHYGQDVTLYSYTNINATFQQYNDYVLNEGSYTASRLEKYNDLTGLFETVINHDIDAVTAIGFPSNSSQYNVLRAAALSSVTETVHLTEGRYRLVCESTGPGVNSSMNIKEKFTYRKNATTYNAGGLRIKKINFISNSVPDTSYTKVYTYTDGNNSSGVLETPFANVGWSYYYGEEVSGQRQSCSFIDLSISPQIPLGNSQGGTVGYAKVQEKRLDNSKKIYYFTNGTDGTGEYADYFIEGYDLPTRIRVIEDNSWKRGVTKQIDYYNSADELVKRDFMEYSAVEDNSSETSISLYLDNVKLYQYDEYSADPFFYIRYNRHLLKSRDSVVFYNATGHSYEVINYGYHTNANPHANPTVINAKNSSGEIISKRLTYPLDFNVGSSPTNATAIAIKNLQSRHVTIPVEQYVVKMDGNGSNTRTVSAEYVTFKQGSPFPDKVYKLKTDVPLTNFTTASITSGTTSIDSRYDPVLEFVNYDTFGNITEQKKTQGTKEVLVWGYNHQELVAKVTSADYSTVIALVDTTVLNNPSSDAALRTELNKIRTHFAGTESQVTSYTYTPLVGITSITDPKGATLFYEYDAYRRLKIVKDQNGNIVRHTAYNFKP